MGITAFFLLYKCDLNYDVLIRRRISDTQIEGIAIDMGLMCSNCCFCQVSCVRVYKWNPVIMNNTITNIQIAP